jgi:hypothetical protein
MKFAILIYAVLTTHAGDEVERFISWNLPFENYYKCSLFYKENFKKEIAALCPLELRSIPSF